MIFDSRAPIDTGRGVDIDATAGEVKDDAEIELLMSVFSEGSVAQGGARNVPPCPRPRA